MSTLAQEHADYSRQTDRDGAVRPTEDNGFRMKETEPFTYTPRRNPPVKSLLDHVHEDDISQKLPARGLRGVFYITLDENAARRRITQDICINIAARKAQDAANALTTLLAAAMLT